MPRRLIERAWGHGFVHIKLLDGLPVGSGALGEARLAARYLARYVGRDLDDERRLAGLHRYEVAQGFQPAKVECYGALGRGRDRAGLAATWARAGAGLVVVDGGGVAWAARLLGAVGLTSYRPARVAWVERSCADQGVPVKLTDPQAVAKVAELLAQGRQTRRQARLVEAVVAAPAGADDDVVEHGGDDRVLLAEVERVPLLAQLLAVADVAVERAACGDAWRAACARRSCAARSACARRATPRIVSSRLPVGGGELLELGLVGSSCSSQRCASGCLRGRRSSAARSSGESSRCSTASATNRSTSSALM